MKTVRASFAAGLMVLCACTETNRPQRAPGAAGVGAPERTVDRSVLGAAPAGGDHGPEPGVIRMPERITLPACYRLILLDGHLALVRETDAQAIEPTPTSMRIVMGEIARGELAYQPALLPQELAAEVASNRESAARMDNALDGVMRRSRELSEQALELEAQGRKLAGLLAAAEARARAFEAPGTASQAKPVPKKPENKEPPE
jgi:hypothetical protein